MKYYTMRGAARKTGQKYSTIYRWTRMGHLPSIFYRGKRLIPETGLVDLQPPGRGERAWKGVPPDYRHERRVPDEVVTEMLADYIAGNGTLQTYGDRHGLTRERIRQLFLEKDPNFRQKRIVDNTAKKKAAKEIRDTKKLLELMQQAIDEDRHCIVCGAWVIRKTPGRKPGNEYMTCSPEHAIAWPVLRTVDETDLHRRRMAQVYTRSPHLYSPSAVEWGKKVMAGDLPPQNRTYLVPGSRRAEMIRLYRPEAYRYLTCKCPNLDCQKTCVYHEHEGLNAFCRGCLNEWTTEEPVAPPKQLS